MWQAVADWAEAIAKAVRPPKRRQLDLRLVSYAEADELLLEGWTIAKEEDGNRQIGYVWMELLEPENTFRRN